MSRRRRPAAGGAERAERKPEQVGGGPEPTGAPGRRPPRIPFISQVAILLAVFAIVSLIAYVAGAANLGVALGIGQIAFAIALVVVIVKT